MGDIYPLKFSPMSKGIKVEGSNQCYQHLNIISNIVISSCFGGPVIFSNIFLIFFDMLVLLTFSDIFLDVSNIFFSKPSTIFSTTRCW
jgi:hypothetical protein